MGVCFRCELESSKLFDVVVKEGIVGVCFNCIDEDEMPLIQKPSEEIFQEPNKKQSVYERLGSFAGIDLKEHKSFDKRNQEQLDEQDKELIEIVKKNVQADLSKTIEESVLVRNFHWIIMRARRLRKLTIKELAKKIIEPEEVLVFIEKGFVSENNLGVVKKLEIFLGIQLFTKEAREKKNLDKGVLFDSIFSKSVTIDDLRELKKKREFSSKDKQPKSF
ncbi:MAG: hypothetical protein ABFQ65_04295 [Nanoarchaeota archaeon]